MPSRLSVKIVGVSFLWCFRLVLFFCPAVGCTFCIVVFAFFVRAKFLCCLVFFCFVIFLFVSYCFSIILGRFDRLWFFAWWGGSPGVCGLWLHGSFRCCLLWRGIGLAFYLCCRSLCGVCSCFFSLLLSLVVRLFDSLFLAFLFVLGLASNCEPRIVLYLGIAYQNSINKKIFQ